MKKNKLLTLSVAALLGFGAVGSLGIKLSAKKAAVASNTIVANEETQDVDGKKIGFPNHVRREGDPDRSVLESKLGVRIIEAEEGKKNIQFIAALSGYADLASAKWTRTVTAKSGTVLKEAQDIAVTNVYTTLAAADEVVWDTPLSIADPYYMIYTLKNVPESAWSASFDVTLTATYTDGTNATAHKASAIQSDAHEHAVDGKYSVVDIDDEGTLVAMHCTEDGTEVNPTHVATPAGELAVTAENILDGVEGLFLVTNGTTNGWEYDAEKDAIVSTNAGTSSSSSKFTIKALSDITIKLTSNVNSESNFDYISNSFGTTGSHTYISGANQSSNTYYSSKVSGKNGETITVEHEIFLSEGSDMSWSYSKDSSGNNGDDMAWITNFKVLANSIPVSASDLSAVTFDTQGGSSIAPAVLYTGKKAAAPAADPTKEGYVFDGWFADKACLGAFDFANTAITEDTVVYAKWIVAKTVTINANNGSAASTATVGEGKTYDAGKPEREGYKFCGWYTDESCSDGNEFTAETVVSADVSIYAKWEEAPAYAGYTYHGCEYYGEKSGGSYVEHLTLTYENTTSGKWNGAVISSYDETTGAITWGPSAGNPSYGAMIYKEGILVAPYYYTSNTLTSTGDVMLFSRYNAVDFKGKSFAFKGASTNEYINRVFQTQNSEGEIQLNFLYEGALYTNVSISSLTGTPNLTTLDLSSLKDFEIKASNGDTIGSFGYDSVAKKYAVADANYGAYTGTLGNLIVNGTGTAVAVTGTGDDEVRTTYSYVSSETGIRITSGTSVYDVTFDGTTYTAVAPTTTITYNTKGGDAIEAGTFTTSLAVGTLPTATREGYIFKGWYLDEEYEHAVTASYIADEDVTLYAKWSESATLTFESNGGTVIEAMTVETGDAITAPANPTKEGYRFDGWYTDETCLSAFDFSAGISEATTIYAKWVATVTVTLHNPTGPATDSTVTTIDQGTAYEAKTPSTPGYTGFVGWYTDEACNTPYVEGEVNSNLDLYAKWTGNYANDAANYVDSVLGDAASYIGWGNRASWSGAYSWNYDAETNTLTPNNKGVSNSYATFSITFAKAGTFSFNYACSSESGYDGLEVQHKEDASSSSWTKDLTLKTASGKATGTVTLDVTAGEIVSFYYKKDGSGNGNDDTVRLTNITWQDYVEEPAAFAGNWTDGTNALVLNDDGATGTINGEAFSFVYDEDNEEYCVEEGAYAGSFFAYFAADEEEGTPEGVQCCFIKDGDEDNPIIFTVENNLVRGEPEPPVCMAIAGSYTGASGMNNYDASLEINADGTGTFVCEECGVDETLTFDHKDGRDYYFTTSGGVTVIVYSHTSTTVKVTWADGEYDDSLGDWFNDEDFNL